MKMWFPVSAAIALSATAPAFAQSESMPMVDPAAEAMADRLTMEQQTALRCSALFAIVARQQANGNAEALAYPDVATRGREYMVRSMARLMDEEGLDRATVSRLLSAQAQALWDNGQALDEMVPPCLSLLEVSGL